ncbi:hypothetical protein HDV01_007486 [Terramyces sp. JEL0728]|nr:hypothetical protein HDV01_007486 [Terramyces sp. JEL0728]
MLYDKLGGEPALLIITESLSHATHITHKLLFQYFDSLIRTKEIQKPFSKMTDSEFDAFQNTLELVLKEKRIPLHLIQEFLSVFEEQRVVFVTKKTNVEYLGMSVFVPLVIVCLFVFNKLD